ncbi:MAG: hypothetical protein WCA49_25035 [Candidatus Sulfotelmatobacter sp.]
MPRGKRFDFEKIWDWAQKWFFIPLVAVIFVWLLAWSIDSVRTWMQGHGLGRDVPAVVGIALAATMFVLVSFQQQLRQVAKRLGDFSPSASSRIIRGGIKDVYPELQKILAELGAGSSSERSLDVLGLTLFTAWPMLLQPGLSSAEGALRGWRVNVFLLCPDFIKSNPCFSAAWALQAEAQLLAIKEFATNNAQLLKELKTDLAVTKYKFFPAVHGFRTGAGHLLISYIHWNGTSLEGPTQFYEFFQPSDKSARASLYRDLFGNWIERAKREAAAGKVI